MERGTDGLLPAGHQIAVAWSIGENYGGMTAALLHRQRVFADHGATDLTVVTLDPIQDVPKTVERLEQRGVLAENVQVRNMWFEAMHRETPRFLRNNRRKSDALGSALTILSEPPKGFATRTDSFSTGARVTTLTRQGARDRLHGFYRPDGSLAALDWYQERPDAPERLVAAFDHRARPIGVWEGAWPLYRRWMDELVARERTFITVDSKALVSFFATYSNRHAFVTHVVHGAHLALAANDAHGTLSAKRKPMVTNAHNYDAIVLLTEQQCADVAARASSKALLVTIPNSTVLPQDAVNTSPAGRGAMVAQLSARKRVDHAITAIARANQPTSRGVTLDIFGGGALQPRLEQIASERCGDQVRFRGYVDHAADQLTQYSFLLLTSSAEGLPLVLAEAMARGCLPIAYDIRYGPRNIIDDGVDGFLIPAGDPAAAAEAIKKLVSLPEATVATMRRAAITKASRYSDAAVAAQWSALQHRLIANRPPLGHLRAAGRRFGDRLRRFGANGNNE